MTNQTTKTPLDSYGPAASKYRVLYQLALLLLTENCECSKHSPVGCRAHQDQASDEAWSQLTPTEREHEQDLQRNAHPIPESERVW